MYSTCTCTYITFIPLQLWRRHSEGRTRPDLTAYRWTRPLHPTSPLLRNVRSLTGVTHHVLPSPPSLDKTNRKSLHLVRGVSRLRPLTGAGTLNKTKCRGRPLPGVPENRASIWRRIPTPLSPPVRSPRPPGNQYRRAQGRWWGFPRKKPLSPSLRSPPNPPLRVRNPLYRKRQLVYRSVSQDPRK